MANTRNLYNKDAELKTPELDGATIPENGFKYNFEEINDIIDQKIIADYKKEKEDNQKEIDRLKNNKVMINHAKYITDTNVGYLLGNPVDYQPSEGYDIEPILDAYKKQTINDLDSELAKDISIFGLQYEYVYEGNF